MEEKLLSTREILDRTHELFVGWVSVDSSREDRAVSRESLGETDVFGPTVQVRARRVSKRMKVEVTFEAGAVLPEGETMSQLSRGQSSMLAAHEEGRICVEIVSIGALLLEKLFKFGTESVGQDNFLGDGIFRGAFEDAKADMPACVIIPVENVADVQCENLMFPKSRSKGNTENDVVSPSGGVLSSRAQKQRDFSFGEGTWRSGKGVCVIAHELIQASFQALRKGKWQ